MTNAFFDYITSSALSLTMAGNTGISPFLTLLILGLVEMGKPELLNMGETMEVILASWWSIGILGLLTIGEMIGKCIPVIDELIDSAEVFVVPAISILASMATLGLLPVPGGSQSDAGQGQSIDVLGIFGSGDGYRSLQEEDIGIEIDVVDDDSNDFGEGFITFTKICLVVIGIGLSLLIHFFKMLIRASSLACSGGCCQPCITITEFLLVVFGVLFAILVPVFAIFMCIALLIAAGYVIRFKFCNMIDDDDKNKNNNGLEKKDTTDGRKNDVENQGLPPAEATAELVLNTSKNAPSEVLSMAEFVTVPLPPPIAPKPDVEARTY